MGNKVSIKLLGSSFTINVNEDSDYLGRIISYLEDKITEVQSTLHIKEPLKISLLTCIFLVDELFRERSNSLKDRSDAEAFAEKLISSIDAVLNEEK